MITLCRHHTSICTKCDSTEPLFADKDQHSPATIPGYHHPPDSSPPKRYHPPTNRVWGAGDLPKTRVRRHPKTVALAAAMKAEALDSRTQVKSLSLTHRQFYNA